MGQRQMKSPNPFSGGVDALSDADFALLVDAVETRRCRELVGAGTYDEAARKWRPRPRLFLFNCLLRFGAGAVLLDSSLIPSPPIMPQDRARVDDP